MTNKEIDAGMDRCYGYGNLDRDKVRELIKRIAKDEYNKGYDEGFKDLLKKKLKE